jgi:hypothetical protein
MKFSKLLSNKFVRITLMIFFFLFVYKILFAIGLFFAIDSVILSMYLCWIGMIIAFGSLLQVEKTHFNVTNTPPLFNIKKITDQMTTLGQTVTDVTTPTLSQSLPPIQNPGVKVI